MTFFLHITNIKQVAHYTPTFTTILNDEFKYRMWCNNFSQWTDFDGDDYET